MSRLNRMYAPPPPPVDRPKAAAAKAFPWWLLGDVLACLAAIAGFVLLVCKIYPR